MLFRSPLGTVTTRDRHALVRGDEMRMVNVPELRRAMTLPDSYVLTGTQAEQIARIGNSVSPPMARAVVAANVVAAKRRAA